MVGYIKEIANDLAKLRAHPGDASSLAQALAEELDRLDPRDLFQLANTDLSSYECARAISRRLQKILHRGCRFGVCRSWA